MDRRHAARILRSRMPGPRCCLLTSCMKDRSSGGYCLSDSSCDREAEAHGRSIRHHESRGQFSDMATNRDPQRSSSIRPKKSWSIGTSRIRVSISSSRKRFRAAAWSPTTGSGASISSDRSRVVVWSSSSAQSSESPFRHGASRGVRHPFSDSTADGGGGQATRTGGSVSGIIDSRRRGSSPSWNETSDGGQSNLRFPKVGECLGGFRIILELGRGAFARVYLAEEINLGCRPVAIKVSTARG